MAVDANKGRMRLPTVDGAMNKIGPQGIKLDDKGSVLGAKMGKAQDKQAILEKMRKRMERAIGAESENRKNGLDDRKFEKGEQWPSEIMAQRSLDKRPCETINKLPTFIHQITNDQRQNRPSINISPVGDRGDPEVAKMYRGLIRFIERDCAADIAYDTAFKDAVTMGWGYWRILTEWEAPDSFNLSLVIRRIRNPFTVYLDPSAQDPTGADARWGFITEMMTRDEFEAKYPDADPMPYTEAGIGDNMKAWASKDEIRIAEYFSLDYKTKTLVELSNGHVGWEDDLDDITRGYLKRGKIEIVDERESRVPTVKWYKATAKDILMEREWFGTTVPIVRVIGDEIDIEGRVTYAGVVRHAKGPQRMFNYWRNALTELVALAPKAPWIMEEGQVEGHEDEWASANIRPMPYLTYKGTNVNGTPVPPPQRQPFAGVPGGVEQAASNAAQDMMATTGVRFDATMNERMIDESGKAIRELRRSGDIGSFHYVDNLARALKRTGEILVEMIPMIYSDARVITILREDDKEERVKIDPALPRASAEVRGADGKPMKLFNPKHGKYGVTVTIGPSFATKRIEAAESMMQFARALPQTATLISDLIVKYMDFPGADEIAARLSKTLPPNLLAPDMKDVSPQIQAILQAQDAQVKDLGQKLQAAMIALNDKSADRAIEMEKIGRDFEAKLLKIVSDTETKVALIQEKADASYNAHIGSQIKQLGLDVAELIHGMPSGQAVVGGEQPGAQQQPVENDVLPPQAAQSLKEGRVTTFKNGSKWTMKDGNPVRVA